MPKQVVYRFNARPENDQVKVDLDDEIELPSKGSVLVIDGKRWKVIEIMTERSLDARGPIPVVTIYLTNG
jgi:hypothetical protein